MQSLTLSALLRDAGGALLLIRRKDSSVWELPGGEVPADTAPVARLAALCRRQVGVTPDLVAPLRAHILAGERVTVGCDEVARDAVRPCGRVAELCWWAGASPPPGSSPLVRMVLAAETPRVIPRWARWPQASVSGRPSPITEGVGNGSVAG